VRAVFRLPLQGRDDHIFDSLVGDRAWRARTRFVSKPVEPLVDEPLAPLANHLRGNAQLLGHLLIGIACRATQHDPAPLREGL
jgi:hypothetical protein